MKIPKSVEELEAYRYADDIEKVGIEKANQLRQMREFLANNPTDGYWGTGQSFFGGLIGRVIWTIIIGGIVYLISVISGQN